MNRSPWLLVAVLLAGCGVPAPGDGPDAGPAPDAGAVTSGAPAGTTPSPPAASSPSTPALVGRCGEACSAPGQAGECQCGTSSSRASCTCAEGRNGPNRVVWSCVGQLCR